MAKIIEPISDEELKRITAPNLRKEYIRIADFLRKILNGEIVKCNCCGEWKNANSFYHSDKSADGIEHYGCRECILDQCTDYDKKTKIRTDNREKTIATFKKLDWYFNEKLYNDQFSKLAEGTGEKIRSTAVQQWIVISRSLNDYRNLCFADSEFLDDDSEILELTSKRKPRKEIIKLFGSGFSTEDYLYLQDQYDDWCARTQVDSKSQQTYIVRICFKLLDIYKAQKIGKDTEKLDRSLNELLAAANLQPRQNVGNAAMDSLSFGQMIEKWEEEEPVYAPDPEFADVDGIGKYIRVWFKGHLARALGLDNGYSKEYDEYIKQYTVTKPDYEEDGKSEAIYQTLFGNESE
jgi:hypothetical protein